MNKFKIIKGIFLTLFTVLVLSTMVFCKTESEFSPSYPILGTLTLIDEGKDIEVDLLLSTSAKEFKYGGLFHEFQEGNDSIKGLVFNYYHELDSSRCDSGKDSHYVHISDTIPNTYNWEKDKLIRVMRMNENDSIDFNRAKDFFKSYLIKFRYKDVMNNEFQSSIQAWNFSNSNFILNECDTIVRTKGSGSNVINYIPRYVKNGGVLQLKLRKNG